MVFTHLDIKFPKVTEVTEGGKRYYIQDGSPAVPSITTILNKVPKPHLARWQQKVGEAKATEIRNLAAERGTALHSIIEIYLKNETLLIGRGPANVMFGGLRKHLDKINYIACQEQALYSKKFGVAGRVDCVAQYEGVPSIIDFKQSNKRKKNEWIHSYYLQATAYAGLYEDVTGIPINQIVIMIAVENELPQIFIKKPINYVKDLVKAIKFYHETA